MKHFNIRLIAFQGLAFSGKDTACNILKGAAAHVNHQVIEARFAEPLYEMVRALVPCASSQLPKEEKEAPREELGGLSIREMLIAIGEGARQYDPLCWVKAWRASLLEDIDLAVGGAKRNILVLVPDLRKENEAEAFRQIVPLVATAASGDPETTCHVTATLVHLRALNAPVNPNPNAATEVLLQPKFGEPVIVNDHSQGLQAFADQVLRLFNQEINRG